MCCFWISSNSALLVITTILASCIIHLLAPSGSPTLKTNEEICFLHILVLKSRQNLAQLAKKVISNNLGLVESGFCSSLVRWIKWRFLEQHLAKFKLQRYFKSSNYFINLIFILSIMSCHLRSSIQVFRCSPLTDLR